MVWCKPLVDLTWNDPNENASFFHVAIRKVKWHGGGFVSLRVCVVHIMDPMPMEKRYVSTQEASDLIDHWESMHR